MAHMDDTIGVDLPCSIRSKSVPPRYLRPCSIVQMLLKMSGFDEVDW
jgi:hypothetical protein